jgi:hypothetical protein
MAVLGQLSGLIQRVTVEQRTPLFLSEGQHLVVVAESAPNLKMAIRNLQSALEKRGDLFLLQNASLLLRLPLCCSKADEMRLGYAHHPELPSHTASTPLTAAMWLRNPSFNDKATS